MLSSYEQEWTENDKSFQPIFLSTISALPKIRRTTLIELTFIEHNGEVHNVRAAPGTNLMQAALDNNVPGIDADCGGSCACGTCHVFIDTSWMDKAGEPSESECAMLEMTPEKNEMSRLACQITVETPLNGLVVKLPEFQM
jgi:2Fe-2S ferredoxin